MSQGVRIPYPEAKALADELRALLAPDCARIEIAGSIRRRRATVADIELVAIAHHATQIVPGLFESTTVEHDMLAQGLRVLLEADEPLLALREVEVHRKDGTVEIQHRDGASWKALTFRGFGVDLFITDTDGWGVIFALRTGPGDWNQRLVEDCKRYGRRVEGSRVLHMGRPVATPEEEDFFAAIGQPWLAPQDRRVERVHIVPPARLATVT